MNILREARTSDIPGIVDVHLASFQNFFLSFLGRTFLEHLYREVATESGAVLLIATTTEDKVIGFAAGVPDLRAFYGRIVRGKWHKFGLASLRAALRRPSIIPRLWRALSATKSASEASCPATLMSIAVAPHTKSQGVGKCLIRQFLDEMKKRGVESVCLSTDRDDNQATLAFYEKLGFRRVREYCTKEGRWLCEYCIRP